MRIGLIVGTRPEFIKTWSVIEEIKKRENLELILIHTGQHYDYEMSRVFFEDLSIQEPDYYLEVGSHSPVEQTRRIMERVSEVIGKEPIDILLVQGDTNSCMGAALAAALMRVPVGHIEAGCRSYDKTMPEEVNRILIDSISSMLFAPSYAAYNNLLMEGHDKSRLYSAGNTAVDALQLGLSLVEKRQAEFEKPYAVATVHRAANTDDRERLTQILDALAKLPFKCVCPMHPRTEKMIQQFGLQKHLRSSLCVIKPTGYVSFINLLKHASLVITDSGGVQEEAAILGKRTVTIRKSTEWPETVWAGLNVLAEPYTTDIISSVDMVMKRTISAHENLYLGDAGKKIVDAIVKAYEENKLCFEETSLIKSGYPELWLSNHSDNYIASFDENGHPVLEKGKRFLVRGCRPLTFGQDE